MNEKIDNKIGSELRELNNDDLIDQFYASCCEDLEVGRELSRRIFQHAEIPEDVIDQIPLTGKDGQRIELDGVPCTLVDYVNYAAKNHLDALEAILDFLKTDVGSDEYRAFLETMRNKTTYRI
jgi:hypothetical protein